MRCSTYDIGNACAKRFTNAKTKRFIATQCHVAHVVSDIV